MNQRQNQISEPIAPVFYKVVLNLETALATALPNEEAKKKLNAKARTAVKQKVKKAIREKEQEFKSYQDVSTFI